MADDLRNETTTQETQATQETSLDDLLAAANESTDDDISINIVESQDIVKSMAKSGSISSEKIEKFIKDSKEFIKATEYRGYLENVKNDIISVLLSKTEDEDVKSFITNDLKTSMIVQYPIYQSCARLAKARGSVENDEQQKYDVGVRKACIVYPLFAYYDIDPNDLYQKIKKD